MVHSGRLKYSRSLREGVAVMRQVVIVNAVHSAIGRHNGGLARVRPGNPWAEVLKALVARLDNRD
jgi:acetyl-CoA acetyltransferase